MEPQKVQRGWVGRPFDGLWGRAAANCPAHCGAETPGKHCLTAFFAALPCYFRVFRPADPCLYIWQSLVLYPRQVIPSGLLASVWCDVHWAVQEDDWRARESAILALGAISEGCANGLLGHLTEMVHIMLPMLLDARPLVRSISCWALSRYSYWIVQASIEMNSQGKQQFDTVVAVRFLSHLIYIFCAVPLAGVMRPRLHSYPVCETPAALTLLSSMSERLPCL